MKENISITKEYNQNFSDFYSKYLTGFAKRMAVSYHDYDQKNGVKKNSILDICCGTGEFLEYFYQKEYVTHGLDLSEEMLDLAQKKAKQKGFVNMNFKQADASNFSYDVSFGLVTATSDALNHLPSEESIRSCFQCVHNVLNPEGLFIFDFNTKKGTLANQGVSIHQDDNYFLMRNGIYDILNQKGITLFSGFFKKENSENKYSRFNNRIYNNVYPLDSLEDWLYQVGFTDVKYVYIYDFNEILKTPENENRIVCIAKKEV